MVNSRGRPATCRLCERPEGKLFHEDGRRYFRCCDCGLVFVDPEYFLDGDRERAVYDQHQNSPGDAGYRRFLSRLYEPVVSRLAPGSRGFDFGSGPGPTLSVMFEEAGHHVSLFDPFYANDPTVFDQQYQFITASEVFEHLCHPRMELDRLWRCLEPGGVLGVMTKRVRDQDAFSRWHYKNDPTHVCFFSLKTFEWLEEHWAARLEVVADDVVVFEKNGSALS